jgi:uncharacterized protein YecT (DUF1311 family)
MELSIKEYMKHTFSRLLLLFIVFQLFHLGICEAANNQKSEIKPATDLKMKYADVDGRLNERYKSTLNYASELQKDSLRRTQRIWIDYRDAKCNDITEFSRAKDVSKEDILLECKIWETTKRTDELICLSETLMSVPPNEHIENKIGCAYNYPVIAKTDPNRWIPKWPKTNQIVKSDWLFYIEGEKGPSEGYVLEDKPLDYYRYNLVDYYPDLKYFGEIKLEITLVGKLGLYNIYDAISTTKKGIKLILVETRPMFYKPIYLLVPGPDTTNLPSKIILSKGKQMLVTESPTWRGTYKKSFILNDKMIPTPLNN